LQSRGAGWHSYPNRPTLKTVRPPEALGEEGRLERDDDGK
jgi:hypothetical protein